VANKVNYICRVYRQGYSVSEIAVRLEITELSVQYVVDTNNLTQVKRTNTCKHCGERFKTYLAKSVKCGKCKR